MKYFKILTILLFTSIISFYGCNNNSKAPAQETKKAAPAPLEVFDANNQPNANNANQTLEPAQNTQGVWHYTCSKGCAGGAGSAIACSTCGNTLAHNQGYHSNTPSTTPPPEPSQNAAGVWHYTCANGCAGGGGSASACGSCGNTLAHNTAYHQ